MVDSEVHDAERFLRGQLLTHAQAQGQLLMLKEDLARHQEAVANAEQRVQQAEQGVAEAREFLARVLKDQAPAAKLEAARKKLDHTRRQAAERQAATAANLARAQQEHLAATEALTLALTPDGAQTP